MCSSALEPVQHGPSEGTLWMKIQDEPQEEGMPLALVHHGCLPPTRPANQAVVRISATLEQPTGDQRKDSASKKGGIYVNSVPLCCYRRKADRESVTTATVLAACAAVHGARQEGGLVSAALGDVSASIYGAVKLGDDVVVQKSLDRAPLHAEGVHRAAIQSSSSGSSRSASSKSVTSHGSPQDGALHIERSFRLGEKAEARGRKKGRQSRGTGEKDKDDDEQDEHVEEDEGSDAMADEERALGHEQARRLFAEAHNTVGQEEDSDAEDFHEERKRAYAERKKADEKPGPQEEHGPEDDGPGSDGDDVGFGAGVNGADGGDDSPGMGGRAEARALDDKKGSSAAKRGGKKEKSKGKAANGASKANGDDDSTPSKVIDLNKARRVKGAAKVSRERSAKHDKKSSKKGQKNTLDAFFMGQ